GQEALGPPAVAPPPPPGIEGDADVPAPGGGGRPVVDGVPADVADGNGALGAVDLDDQLAVEVAEEAVLLEAGHDLGLGAEPEPVVGPGDLRRLPRHQIVEVVSGHRPQPEVAHGRRHYRRLPAVSGERARAGGGGGPCRPPSGGSPARRPPPGAASPPAVPGGRRPAGPPAGVARTAPPAPRRPRPARPSPDRAGRPRRRRRWPGARPVPARPPSGSP